ncbi:HNH endonuclease [Micromonospora echinofusca]|uniref:HNH endonuclease n=1 Tax=Micromonospora echinofusca TaxID=47858 RepID=UPI0037B2B5D3
MFELSAIELDDEANFRSISNSRRAKLDRHLLHLVEPSVLASYTAYSKSAGYAKKMEPIEVDEETKKALVRNYNSLDTGGSHGDLRSRILGLARNSRCPYCRRVDVVTLDHYLPKNSWPELSVFSRNLIPVCMECNWKKLNKVGIGLDRFIHPYFDSLPAASVLFADVLDAKGRIAVAYRIDASEQVPEELLRAWSFHFAELGLADVYAADAVEEVAVLAETVRILSEGGASSVGIDEHVEIQLRSLERVQGLNHWKPVLYKSISTVLQSSRRDDFVEAITSF